MKKVAIAEPQKFALLRIAFGFAWLADAVFKWQPSFFDNFTSYLENGAEGQPALVQNWIHFWIVLVGINPQFFAFVVAIAETLLAASLIFGVLVNVACYGGILLSFVIWSTAEGFGGPYTAGSTDIGSAIIYTFVFVALILGKSGSAISLEPNIRKVFRS